MIFRCAVCDTYWHAHDSSASVRDSLCKVHRKNPSNLKYVPLDEIPIVPSLYELVEKTPKIPTFKGISLGQARATTR